MQPLPPRIWTGAALFSAVISCAYGQTISAANAIRDVLENPALQSHANRFQEQFGQVANAVDDAAMGVAKRGLPTFKQHLGQLKYGTHNTVSDDGEKIISLIRSLVVSKAEQERKTIIEALKGYNDAGIPEAVHFFGFVTEFGLWEARRDPAKAAAFYAAAAAQNYQPALFNQGLMNLYGRDGSGVADSQMAYKRIMAAHKGFPAEDSYRVCGFAAFLAYRFGNRTEAVSIGKVCHSPLAMLPLAKYEPLSIERKVDLLRKSISTGITDGYNLLQSVTESHSGDDYLHCKYRLVNQYRRTVIAQDGLLREATACVDRTNNKFRKSVTADKRQLVIQGIVAFVPVETQSLQSVAKANPFHYDWSVPYLPFRQVDVELFDAVINAGKNR